MRMLSCNGSPTFVISTYVRVFCCCFVGFVLGRWIRFTRLTGCHPLNRNQLVRPCHPYAGKSDSQAVLSRMQLALHATRRTPHGASRLVQAMSAWSVKTRRVPFRHCRDARVYGDTTTAMHDMSTHPPSTKTHLNTQYSFVPPRDKPVERLDNPADVSI